MSESNGYNINLSVSDTDINTILTESGITLDETKLNNLINKTQETVRAAAAEAVTESIRELAAEEAANEPNDEKYSTTVLLDRIDGITTPKSYVVVCQSKEHRGQLVAVKPYDSEYKVQFHPLLSAFNMVEPIKALGHSYYHRKGLCSRIYMPKERLADLLAILSELGDGFNLATEEQVLTALNTKPATRQGSCY